jgi:hypothetical protein
MMAQFVLVNVVVAVLMKHLEESNATNVAEMEEEADLADVEKAAKKEAEKQPKAAAEQATTMTAPTGDNSLNSSRSDQALANQLVNQKSIPSEPVDLREDLPDDTEPEFISEQISPTDPDKPDGSSAIPIINISQHDEDTKQLDEDISFLDVQSSLSTLNREECLIKKSFEDYDEHEEQSTEDEIKP